MKPETPSELEDCVASVDGMPYRSCRHDGVTRVLHDDGVLCREVRFCAAAIAFSGDETTGRLANGFSNLLEKHKSYIDIHD